MKARWPIPARLNVALSIVQVVGSILLLAAASHAESTAVRVAAVVAFTFLMQLGFSLIHEAEHQKLHPNHAANEGLGILLSAIFPGSFQLMKVAHLAHHRKNRSDAELVDYVRPGENRWLKTAQYYGLICGLIWLGVPLLTLLIALVPSSLLQRTGKSGGSQAAEYLRFLAEARPARVRLELLFAAVLWGVIWTALSLDLAWVALAYGGFAFSWASQQYIYHIRTPRHLVEGAFNLRIFRPLGWLYLHFNYHLTHHRAVQVPWLYLPEATLESPHLSYSRKYLELWLPPEPVSRAFPVEHQTKGPLPAQKPASSGPESRVPASSDSLVM